MAEIKLRKLLSQQANLDVLSGMLGLLGADVCIQDTDGIAVIGVPGNSSEEKHPVRIADETIGWVLGGSTAPMVASFITFLATREWERRALARETLDRYKELSLLYNFMEKIALCLNLKEVAQLVIEETRKNITSTSASVMLLNQRTQEPRDHRRGGQGIFAEDDAEARRGHRHRRYGLFYRKSGDRERCIFGSAGTSRAQTGQLR